MYSISFAVSFLETPTRTHKPRPMELITDPSTVQHTKYYEKSHYVKLK